MPSIQHEAMVQLFRNRPELAVRLLEQALGLRVPEHEEAGLEDSDLSQVAPTEYRADAVVVLRGAGRAVHAIVVEVQLSVSKAKLLSWPAYAVNLRARLASTHRAEVSMLT